MRYNKNIESATYNPLWIYLKGIIGAGIFVLFTFLIMAFMITYTNMSETIIPMINSIAMIASSSISGMYVGAKMKKKGWLNGVAVAFIYVLFLVFMSWVFVSSFEFNKYVLYKCIIGTISGGIGGMIGVNLK